MRYLILVLLNLPVILLALIDVVIRYKTKKTDKEHFRKQFLLWVGLFVVLICSFPVYNIVAGNPIFDSSKLSFFDIAQTVAIVLLFYITNSQRQHLERTERQLHDLHQELSIILSKKQ